MPQTIWATVMLGGPGEGDTTKGMGQRKPRRPLVVLRKVLFCTLLRAVLVPIPKHPPQLSQTRHRQAQPEAHGPAHLLSDLQLQQ